MHKLYLLWRACNRLIKGQVYNHHRQITSLFYWKGITHNIKATIATIDTAHQPPTQMFIWQLKSINKRKDNIILCHQPLKIHTSFTLLSVCMIFSNNVLHCLYIFILSYSIRFIGFYKGEEQIVLFARDC